MINKRKGKKFIKLWMTIEELTLIKESLKDDSVYGKINVYEAIKEIKERGDFLE